MTDMRKAVTARGIFHAGSEATIAPFLAWLGIVSLYRGQIAWGLVVLAVATMAARDGWRGWQASRRPLLIDA